MNFCSVFAQIFAMKLFNNLFIYTYFNRIAATSAAESFTASEWSDCWKPRISFANTINGNATTDSDEQLLVPLQGWLLWRDDRMWKFCVPNRMVPPSVCRTDHSTGWTLDVRTMHLSQQCRSIFNNHSNNIGKSYYTNYFVGTTTFAYDSLWFSSHSSYSKNATQITPIRVLQ